MPVTLTRCQALGSGTGGPPPHFTRGEGWTEGTFLRPSQGRRLFTVLLHSSGSSVALEVPLGPSLCLEPLGF